MKYHVNPATGTVAACHATGGRCPFGEGADHFSSAKEARNAYESKMQAQLVPASSKTTAKEIKAKKVRKLHPGGYEIECPNPNCKTYAHDLRNPDKVKACFTEAVRLEPENKGLYWSRYFTARDECMSSGHWARDVANFHNRINTYTGQLAMNPRLAEITAKVKSFTANARNFPNPLWIDNNCSAPVLLLNFYKIAETTRVGLDAPVWHTSVPRDFQGLLEYNQILAEQDKASQSRNEDSAIHARTNPGGLTLEQRSLYQLQTDWQNLKENPIRMQTEEITRNFLGIRRIKTVEETKPHPRQVAIEDYVASLSPRCQEIFQLYTVVKDQPNNEAALSRVEHAWADAKKQDETLALNASSEASDSLLDSVNSMLAKLEIMA